MTADELRNRLTSAATNLGWKVSSADEFASRQFRGRSDESSVPLPEEAYGLRLGAYPVIVAPVILGSVEEMQRSLRTLHSQVVIARSYMRPKEVINTHLFLCAVNPEPESDWRSVVDLAERDEAVCRKVIWLPVPNDIGASFDAFCARTFLAAPWQQADQRFDASLDSNQGLALKLLSGRGLSEDAARRWIDIVDRLKDDPDAMVIELAGAGGTAP